MCKTAPRLISHTVVLTLNVNKESQSNSTIGNCKKKKKLRLVSTAFKPVGAVELEDASLFFFFRFRFPLALCKGGITVNDFWNNE